MLLRKVHDNSGILAYQILSFLLNFHRHFQQHLAPNINLIDHYLRIDPQLLIFKARLRLESFDLAVKWLGPGNIAGILVVVVHDMRICTVFYQESDYLGVQVGLDRVSKVREARLPIEVIDVRTSHN